MHNGVLYIMWLLHLLLLLLLLLRHVQLTCWPGYDVAVMTGLQEVMTAQDQAAAAAACMHAPATLDMLLNWNTPAEFMPRATTAALSRHTEIIKISSRHPLRGSNMMGQLRGKWIV